MSIIPIIVPKWGLAMEEGKIINWWVEEGQTISEGDDLVDIETAKITNVCEAHADGVLRRIVAKPDAVLPVGALMGVLADASVPESEIDAFISQFEESFDPGEAAAETAGPEIREINVYGRIIRVAVQGESTSGSPYVLLHGFGGDLNNWMLIQPALAETSPVYAIELPGHGQSSKDVGDGKLETIATGIVAVIEKLDLGAFKLVGHSLGGAIAVEVAARLGNEVSELKLICPASLPGGNTNGDYLDAFVGARRSRDLREPVELLFENADMVSRDMLEDLIKAKRLDGAEAALTLIKEGLKGGDPDYASLGKRLETVAASVSIIASRGDRIVGQPDEAGLPSGARLEWLEGASHMPHLEFSKTVIDFIET